MPPTSVASGFADDDSGGFRVGQEVRVLSGPLNDLSGFVECILHERKSARVVVSVFGNFLSGDFDLADLKTFIQER